jgi:hypothetical protein
MYSKSDEIMLRDEITGVDGTETGGMVRLPAWFVGWQGAIQATGKQNVLYLPD